MKQKAPCNISTMWAIAPPGAFQCVKFFARGGSRLNPAQLVILRNLCLLAKVAKCEIVRRQKAAAFGR
jgi:hypothetical protein